MSTDTEDPIHRKIRKLLALAGNEAAAPGEAANAMRQAQALMRAHGVTDGSLARQAIADRKVHGTRGIHPARWETSLVWLVCTAFGASPLWTRGPKGGQGDKDNGSWTFVAPRSQVEIVVYAYTVLVRQVLAARAQFLADHEDMLRYESRVRKAAEADAFCEGYVYRLREKVSPFALDEATSEALKNHVDSIKNPDPNAAPVKSTNNGQGSLYALRAGQEAGLRAHFHSATTASAPAPQLGGSA